MSDLPRLLLCCFDVVPMPTAISRRMTEYLKGMSDRYQVVVLSVKTADHTHIERYHGARLLRVPVGSGDLAARVQAFDRAVRRQLESEEYVMVHFFDPFGGYALCERRAELGYKLVYDACSLPSVELPMLVDEGEANRRFLAKVRRQELFCLMNADVVIVANELTRDFVTGLGVAREQVQVLPAPVDLGPYTPEVMGVPDHTPMTMIHLGNLSGAQDLGTVLEAMQLALQTVDVRLIVVGPPHPEHQQRLEEQVASLKLTGKVEFQPPVPHDDLHKVLATADVGLLTLADIERNSRVGSPLSRLGEYLAAGRPVLAADVAAARAVLPEDGVVLYRPQDKLSLADAITSLATDPARRVKLSAAARSARLAFDAAKIRADLFATYVALTGTGVRAVGDADLTSPDDVTQLGRSLDRGDTNKKKLEPREDPPSGTNKVKTDPAISAVEETSPEAATSTDRPPVMGVPLHDEPPVVLGIEAQEVAAELGQVSTQPNAVRPTEPPVVMGTPVLVAPVIPTPAVVEPTVRGVGLTPGFVAAELDLDSLLGTATPASTAPVGDLDEPLLPTPAPPLDEEPPDTDGHLSLVPRLPTPPEITAPTTDPSAVPAPAPEPEPPPLFIPPLELPELPSARPQPLPPPKPARTASGLVPALTMPELPTPVGRTTTASQLPIVPAPRPAEPPRLPRAPTSSQLPITPAASSLPPLTRPPALPEAPQVSSPSRPPALPETPPALPKSSGSGVYPVRTASGVFPVVPASAMPVRTSSGIFVPPNLPASKPSAPPPLPRSSSGQFPVVPVLPALELKSQSSGLFPEAPSVPDEAEAIDEHEIEPIEDGPLEVAAEEIVEEAAPSPPPQGSEDSVVMMGDSAVMTVDIDASPPPSAIDPWLAQLVHGYCPPASGLFERHTPPTTMPGRDT